MKGRTLIVVVDASREPDGSDRVRFRGAFAVDDPPTSSELEPEPPGTVRQRFTVTVGDVVDDGIFRFVTRIERGQP